MSMLAALLDKKLSETADLPTYEVPPDGVYKLLIKKVEEKTVDLEETKAVPCLQMLYKVLAPIELKDHAELPLVKEGQEFNESYFFLKDPQKTAEAIATAFRKLGEQLGIDDMNELITKLEGLEVFASIKQREDKKKRVFAQVRECTLTTAPATA